MLTLTLVLVLATICLVAYTRKMAPFYVLSDQIPGPYAFPLIGSAWKFIFKSPEGILHTIHDIIKAYPSPTRFWLGPKLVVAINDPENARLVLTSNRMNQKGYIYRLLQPFLGNGLISGSGTRWKGHRKLIQPFLNNDFVDRTLNLFLQSFAENLLSALEGMTDGRTFDVHSIIHTYVADVLAITILGYDAETRKGKNVALLRTPKTFYQNVTHRITKPLLQLDGLFKLTKLYQKQKDAIEDVNCIVIKAIANAKSRMREGNIKDDSPLVDKFLVAMQQNPGVMTEAELSYQLKTLFVASEDTISNHSCFTLVCLGMAAYSKHQDIILKEIELLPPNTKITEPSALPHLTKCIKEVLRLFPAGPHLFRETVDHFQLGELSLPPRCTVLVNSCGVHRDPKQWERPDDFYPEHFESDAVCKRHPSSFIPFSIGARACAGKALAYPWMKLILAKILEKFVVEADGGLETLKLVTDVTIRADNGYNIKLKQRS